MPESCVFGMVLILLGCLLFLAWLARRDNRQAVQEPAEPVARRRTWYQQVTEPTREEQVN